MTELRRILVIDEGSPGHLVQSRGLAREMAAQSGAALAEYPVRLSLRGVFRPLLRSACGLARRGLPERLLRFAYRLPEAPPPAAEAIVVSGGRGFCYAVSLARRSGAKLIYCGDPAPLPARWCDVVVSPQPLPGHPGALGSGMLLTEISLQRIAGQGDALRQRFAQSGGSLLAALLIGGDSRSHRYTAADWQALIDAVNHLGGQGWRWLLSTSRRTPPAVEARLRAGIRADYLLQAVWWHAAPARVLPAFLDAATLVLVTQDSLSMLSEAVAAGKPALALAPRQVLPSPAIESVLAPAADAGYLRRVPLAELADYRYVAAQFARQAAAHPAALAARVLGLAGLSPCEIGNAS